MDTQKSGLELLREELKSRGLSYAQIHSKAVAVTLDVLANDGTDKYLKVYELEKTTERLQEDIRKEKLRAFNLEAAHRRERQDMQNYRETVMDEIAERSKYIDDFTDKLKQCETAEGRDRMRIAQTFINSVDVDTKYDNTAYIVGLSAILAGAQFDPVGTLKKINKDLPTLEELRWIRV